MKFSLGIRLIVPALALLGVLVSVTPASAAATLLHQYRLNEWTGLADEILINPISLTSHGGVVGTCPGPGSDECQGYTFGQNSGLSLTGGLETLVGPANEFAGDYTIVMDFFLDQSSGVGKVLDFENRGTASATPCPPALSPPATCNSGLYLAGGAAVRRLQVWDDLNATKAGDSGTQVASSTSRVVITRDGSGAAGAETGGTLGLGLNRITVYDDGVGAGTSLSWIDPSADGVFSDTNAIINFFMDDFATGGTTNLTTSGFVDTIRIYGGALSASEVLALVEVPDIAPDTVVPEPASLLLLGAGLAMVGARQFRRRRAAVKV